ncbi:tetratricopeptide repeat protein [Streptomyces turgidiscabies]|uniref:tetratricopeptide repeat protein n=1 Tax=Streptomyces turgidiscabies TaxID=85558 RepID=UPI0038F81F3C
MGERGVTADPRVVELAALKPGAPTYTAGSGYLLHDGLVITAAHTVPEPGTGEVRGRPGGTGPWLRCRVLLHRYEDEDVSGGQEPRTVRDFAVLRIEGEGEDEDRDEGEAGMPAALSALPPVRWGRLATRPCTARVEATGFPDGLRVYEDRGGPRLATVLRDTAHISGTVVSSDPGGTRHVVHVAHPVPPLPEKATGKATTRWDSMSGAAVLCDGLLVGIVVQADDGRRLRIEETAPLWDDPEARELLGLTGVRPRPAELRMLVHHPTARPAHSPISLLRPEAAVVGFHGREDTLRDLAAWRCSSPGHAVLLLTGPGGQGKTRVGLKAVEEAEEAGWTAGFLAERADVRELARLSALDTPLLLVVDYAETRRSQVHALLDLLGTPATSGTSGTARRRQPVRILFLARKAGQWWSLLQGHTHFPHSSDVRPLPPLDPTAAHRATAVRAAMADLGDALTTLYPAPATHQAVRAATPPSVAEDRYAGALNLQMAALVALLQAIDPVPVTDGERHESVLLRHEQKVWKRTADSYGIGGLRLFQYRRLVAAATLCPADDEQQALAVLDRIQPADRTATSTAAPPDPVRCGHWLSGLYPADDDYWGPLQPDRLGEYLLGIVLAEDPELLRRLLPATTERQTAAAFHLLSRAQPHQPHITDPLRDVVAAHPEILAVRAVGAVVAVENPAPLRQALVAVLEEISGAMDRYEPLARRLYDAVPLPTLALDRWAADLAGLLARQPPAPTAQDPHETSAEQARRYHRHAVRLVEIGWIPQARTVCEKSVAVWHALAALGLPEAEGGLGLALNTLALVADHDRSGAEALSLSQHVLRHYQDLSVQDAGTYTGDLAMAWNNHANRLADADRLDEALTGMLTARDLYRDLARDDPAQLSDVALAEYNLIRVHSALGQFGAALADARRATDLYRDLAARWPDQYRAHLPEVLASLAELLRTAGLFEEAVDVVEESLTESRRLVAQAPDRFGQDLAERLSDASAVFDDHGDEDRARAAAEEAVERLRPRAGRDETVAPSLANALIALSHHVPDAAVDLLREAVALYEKAEAAAPGVHGSAPALARAALGGALSEAGLHSESLHAFRESVALLRPPAGLLPAAHGPELAQVLDQQSAALSDAGDPEGALTVEIEAYDVFAVAVDEEPGAFLYEFARVAGNLAIQLRDEGRWPEVLTRTEKVLVLYRLPSPGEYAEDRTERFAILLEFLDHRMVAFSALGRHDEAADCQREAVALRRKIMRADPLDAAHHRSLAGALSCLADTLSNGGRRQEAVGPVREALALTRGRPRDVDEGEGAEEDAEAEDEAEEDDQDGGEAELLVQLAAVLQQAGSAEAFAAAEEAVRYHEDPSGSPAEGREDGYCQALELYAAAQSTAGQSEAAVETCQRLVLLRAKDVADEAGGDLESDRLDLDEALTSLAWVLLEAGSWPRALGLARGVLRSLAAPPAAPPTDTTPRNRIALGAALHVLAQALTAAGHHHEALRAARRAIAVRRRLAARAPEVHLAELAETMGVLSLTLHATGRTAEATTTIRRAVALLTRLAATDPAAHRNDLRRLLRHQARVGSVSAGSTTSD